MNIIAIKIGSGTLLTRRNKPDEYRIAHIRDQIATLLSRECGVVLVVSGAVACGITQTKTEIDILARRAAAGIGQIELIATIRDIFDSKKMRVAQLLLSTHHLKFREGRDQVRNVLEHYLAAGVIPILNENDVVSLNEFGGNDLLVVEVARLLRAHKVLILSQQEASVHGVGGGDTKLQAISLLAKAGISTQILNGKEKNVIINNVL